MSYIRQKNASVVVIENADQALQDHPDLFELVEGDPPDSYEKLIYAPVVGV